MIKLLRITTVPLSLQVLLRGQHRFMSRYFEVTGISSPGVQLQKVGVDEGIRTLPVAMARSISPFRDLKALWQLCRIIRKEKPAIVHTHTPKAGTLGMLAAWLCRVPVRMHTVAGLPLMEAGGVKRMVLNAVEKVTYACATKVYPNSFGLKEVILQNRFCGSAHLKVIGNGSSNGIDTQWFSREATSPQQTGDIRQKWKLTPGEFVFVFVGRLVKDKGINELVAAFTDMHREHTHTRLLLVGNFEPELDPVSPATHQMIDSHPCILYAGFQEDIRPYLAVSHALVFPSYREGFPNVPMQAGAMGLPSVVTDINGCNEIVTHGHNGLVIPPKDVSAIRHAMESLVTDANLYNHLTSNARESIVSRYDQQTLWNLIKEEYDVQLRNAGII